MRTKLAAGGVSIVVTRHHTGFIGELVCSSSGPIALRLLCGGEDGGGEEEEQRAE